MVKVVKVKAVKVKEVNRVRVMLTKMPVIAAQMMKITVLHTQSINMSVWLTNIYTLVEFWILVRDRQANEHIVVDLWYGVVSY